MWVPGCGDVDMRVCSVVGVHGGGCMIGVYGGVWGGMYWGMYCEV